MAKGLRVACLEPEQARSVRSGAGSRVVNQPHHKRSCSVVREVTEEGDGGEVVRAGPSFLEEVTTEVVLNGPVEGHCVLREQSVQVPRGRDTCDLHEEIGRDVWTPWCEPRAESWLFTVTVSRAWRP